MTKEQEEALRRTFASNIGSQLAAHRMTQIELANRLGVGPATVNDWVKGRTTPRSNVLRRLTEVFGCSLSDLLGDGESKEAEELFTITNPDIRMIARAGKKMTPAQAEKLRQLAEVMFPEAFDGNK